MKRPYERYTILEDGAGRLEISIPNPESWNDVIFLGYWLFIWIFGGCYALGSLASFWDDTTGVFQWLFLLIWFACWMCLGFGGLQALVQSSVDESIIAVGQGQLSLYKKGYLNSTPDVYDLKDVKHFRVHELSPMDIDSPGMLQFDYGSQAVEFARELRERDAHAIVARLKTAGILTDENG